MRNSPSRTIRRRTRAVIPQHAAAGLPILAGLLVLLLTRPSLGQEGLLPGELPLRYQGTQGDLLWPERLPTIRQIETAIEDPEVKPLVIFRLHGDKNNHYAPTWASQRLALAFLCADLSAHTSKILWQNLIRESRPQRVYADLLTYEHMASWSRGTERILAFSSDNDKNRHEQIHLLTKDGSARPVTTGHELKMLPSLLSQPGGTLLVYRQDDVLLELEFPKGQWDKPKEVPLGAGEEATFSPNGRHLAIVRSQGGLASQHTLLLHDRSTRQERPLFAKAAYIVRNPTWSLDGKRLAFYSRPWTQEKWELWVVNSQGGADPRQVVPDVRVQEDFRQVGPAWGPNSEKLWYLETQSQQGYYPLCWVTADGASQGKVDYPQRLTTAMDLASCPNPAYAALAFVAVETHSLDVIVTFLNHP